MLSKPYEITGIYKGDGFEIEAGGPPEDALYAWKNPPPHNDVILEKNTWANSDWKAMGVGINGSFAVVWFGKEVDLKTAYLIRMY